MQKTPGSIVRKSVTAGLGFAIAYGSAFGIPMTALAEPAEASITIKEQHNAGATYDAYQLFMADVSDDDEATHVTWASNDMKTLVLAFLDQNGYGNWLGLNHSGNGQRERAQNALEFICEQIEDSQADEDTGDEPPSTQGGSFANRLAKYLTEGNVSSRRATAGSAFKGSEGYWLFVTTDSTAADPDEAGTTPIWVALGGSTSEISEKTAIPTVQKEIREDSISDAAAAWGKTADANRGQEVSYRLTGTLPANFESYDTYHYRFEDRLSPGLDLVIPEGGTIGNALTVTVNGRPASFDSQNLTASLNGQTLVVDFADLKSSVWSRDDLGKDSQIIVEYKARLNSSAAIGATGNNNEVTLVYTNDPITNKEGRTTPPPSPKLFSYQLTLHKIDEQTGEPLSGALFTMQVAPENSDPSSRGLFVQEDGSLAETEHEFATGDDGMFTVSGIDEGTYILSEVEAPLDYDLIDRPVTVTISSTRDETTVGLTGLTATVTGGNDTAATNEFKTALQNSDANAGNVTINVTDNRVLKMPLTGMAGTGAGAGLVVAAATGISLWVRRRRML